LFPSIPELKPNRITEDKKKSPLASRQPETLILAKTKTRSYSSASVAANPQGIYGDWE